MHFTKHPISFLNLLLALLVPALLAACGGGKRPDAPDVITLPATAITATSANINLRVHPNGELTDVIFLWGGDPELFNDYSIGDQSVGDGNQPINVSVALSGLAPDTNYYFSTSARNEHGLDDEGVILSFRTLRENTSYWARSYGTEGHGDTLRAIEFTTDGGYAIAGRVGDALGTRLWVMKFDPNDRLEWQKNYSAIGLFEAFDIDETSDGHLLVAGTSPDPDLATNLLEPYPWLLKLDSAGNLLWQKRYSEFGIFKAVFETADRGAILFAETIIEVPDGIEQDLGIYKIDEEGEVEWFKRLDTGLFDYARSVRPTASGYVIVGESLVLPYLPGPGAYAPPWALEIDSAGNITWQQIYACDLRPEELQVLQSGDLIIVGNNQDGGGLLRLNSSGEYRWMKIFENEDFKSIDTTASDDMFVTGCLGTDPGCGIGIAKLDVLGDQVWAKKYSFVRRDNMPSQGSTRKIREKSDGDLLLVGRYESSHDDLDAQIILLPPNGELAGIDADYTLNGSLELCLETGSTPLTSIDSTESAIDISTAVLPVRVTAFQQASM